VALARGGEALGEETFPGARSCVEELMPRIEGLLKNNSLSLKDLGLIGVDVGPGGLTGLKIGVVTVKTLGQLLDCPVVPVSSMRALCHRAPDGFRTLVPVIKCMKREFFASLYRRGEQGLECLENEILTDFDGFRRIIGKAAAPALVLGDAAGQAEAAAGGTAGGASFDRGEHRFPSAVAICELAAAGEPVSFRDVAPNYICLSNAERNFGIRI